MNNLTSKILDKHGNPIPISSPLKKKAFGQFSSIYEYPNYGRFRPRWYTNQDSELGASGLTRDLLVRWSREVCSQLPWVYSAIRLVALYSVGSSYLPQYKGNNESWGKEATKWLTSEFYPNCNKRGPNYDFATTLFVASMMMDQDGDILCLYGEESGFPKIQLVPAHRITSMGSKYATDTVLPTPNSNNLPVKGPFPNTVVSDGVVYNSQGAPLGYNVVNPDNMVNSLLANQTNMFFSTRDSQLIYDPRFMDRGRGFPSISSGILQALSLQEMESYLVEKLKIESMIGLVEKTPEGLGPEEEANAMSTLLQDDHNMLNGLGPYGNNQETNATKGLRVVNGPTIKYVHANGGEIKTLSSNTPAGETQEYLTRLESHVCQAIGVPHPLIFSPERISGRMSDGIIKIFNTTINYRQKILDKWAGFIVGYALAKAVKNGDLAPNYDENLTQIFDFTHPAPLSLNDGYDRQSDLEDYSAGIKTLKDILRKRNTNVTDFMADIKAEKTLFFKVANEIAKETGTDIKLVITSMQDNLIKISSTENNNTEESNESDKSTK